MPIERPLTTSFEAWYPISPSGLVVTTRPLGEDQVVVGDMAQLSRLGMQPFLVGPVDAGYRLIHRLGAWSDRVVHHDHVDLARVLPYG